MDKVFLVITTYTYKGDHGDPQVEVFSNRHAAIQCLKELKEEDQKCGITDSLKDDLEKNPESWEVIDDEDRYYALEQYGDSWIYIQIFEERVKE